MIHSLSRRLVATQTPPTATTVSAGDVALVCEMLVMKEDGEATNEVRQLRGAKNKNFDKP
jgi:hypothetical protein